MSSFLLIGFFALAGGKRLPSVNPTSASKTWHSHYDSTLQCLSNTLLPTRIRIYSRIHDPVFPDDTLAFVGGKCVVTADSEVLIDAYFVQPVPGNCTDEDYQDHCPDFPFPLVTALGQVLPHTTTPATDSPIKIFSLSVKDYVRDSVKATTLQYFFLSFLLL